MAGTVVILNPEAGSVKNVAAVVRRIRHLPDVEVRLTTRKGAATSFARTALRKGCEMIVAAGGDGTLNEVVNGIGPTSSDVRLGLIPLGTGNDFARPIDSCRRRDSP